jgi:hypothetical protein
MTSLVGCDFSSAPTKRKPIVLAWGSCSGATVRLVRLDRLDSLQAFSDWLDAPGAWVGGFDLPFGLPRPLVEQLGWPTQWEACIRHYAALSRADIRTQFAAYCAARPAGTKFAHRATDRVAISSPSMKWVNPPVAFMLHAGVPLLLDAGVYVPGLHAGNPMAGDAEGAHLRVALEAYPGMLAREILGRHSYKSDDRAKQTPERLIARKTLLTALELGQTRLGLRLKLTHAQRDALVDDASGDMLDATLCLLQAAWGQQQHLSRAPQYGLPLNMDPLEGWIVSA